MPPPISHPLDFSMPPPFMNVPLQQMTESVIPHVHNISNPNTQSSGLYNNNSQYNNNNWNNEGDFNFV